MNLYEFSDDYLFGMTFDEIPHRVTSMPAGDLFALMSVALS